MRLSLVAPHISRRSSTVPAKRLFTTSASVRMSEKYSVKPGGSGGMSGSTQTPANSGIGHDKPKALDADGAIGKQFTGQSSCTPRGLLVDAAH